MRDMIYKIKKDALPFLIVFLLFDIIIVGALIVAYKDVDPAIVGTNRFIEMFNNFLPSITSFKFFTAIFVDFIGFMKFSFWTLIAFVIMFIVWEVKNKKEYEYEGVENGSSDWAKSGEEFRKLPDGREILNRKEGFILSKDHYLGTDLKKVIINKNVLVVGRIWRW